MYLWITEGTRGRERKGASEREIEPYCANLFITNCRYYRGREERRTKHFAGSLIYVHTCIFPYLFDLQCFWLERREAVSALRINDFRQNSFRLGDWKWSLALQKPSTTRFSRILHPLVIKENKLRILVRSSLALGWRSVYRTNEYRCIPSRYSCYEWSSDRSVCIMIYSPWSFFFYQFTSF